MDFSRELADQPSPWPLSGNGNGPLLYNATAAIEQSEDFQAFSLTGIDEVTPPPLRSTPGSHNTDTGPQQALPDAPNHDSQAIDQSSPLLAFRRDDHRTLDTYNSLGQPRNLTIAAHLSGNFSVSRNAHGETQNLVCYRRNLFHVDGSILVPGDVDLISAGAGQSQINKMYAELVAFSSPNREQVKIVALPRTPRAATNLELQSPLPKQLDFRHAARPSNLHTFRLDWPRLQFRTATSKAGGMKHRRKQNFFHISIKVKALTESGTVVTLCEASTPPIVVRGRSPKNFRTSPEIPSTTRGPTERNELPTRPEATIPHFASPELSLVLPDHVQVSGDTMYTEHQIPGIHPDVGFMEHHSYVPDNAEPEALPPNISTNMVDGAKSSTLLFDKTAQAYSSSFPSTSADCASFEDHERATQKNPFYRYIPLAADDRTPAVQAVYQPHYVHHKISTPTEPLSFNKRYFGEPLNAKSS
ncbi:hypothetical protein UA08_09282 [Talaromyces atroroseus]|uniref:NDT80 domain-containing protein n=1 Tax=Talaromyces atroroseus TaxID=1441469 RepID=A0A1Q5Q6I2_TALAT|nr:hypothetical protein UA08_09282 [Talaromyces atroroseus]OKL55457.1 hypothetical protein UA08_09282 [Talaromyces atroroseus]